jgi:hypothetical protein
MLGFPLRYSHEALPELESTPCSRSHPSRHADSFSLRGGDYPSMYLGINGDGELRRRVTTRHR